MFLHVLDIVSSIEFEVKHAFNLPENSHKVPAHDSSLPHTINHALVTYLIATQAIWFVILKFALENLLVGVQHEAGTLKLPQLPEC